MKRANALIGLTVMLFLNTGVMAAAQGSHECGDMVWQRLIDGNQRYVAERLSHPNQATHRSLICPGVGIVHKYAASLFIKRLNSTPAVIMAARYLFSSYQIDIF
jgi:hypothetical protein